MNKQLPKSLWNNKVIHLWSDLGTALREELVVRNLLDRALASESDDTHEVDTQQEYTLHHFARRFNASASRTGFVVLDPFSSFQQLSTELNRILLDGNVSILDAPCGTGGGLLGLVTTLAELRSAGYLPKLPLNISVLGADVCPTSHDIHNSMVQRLRQPLEAVGIRIECSYHTWDVTHPTSTTLLMDRFLQEYFHNEEIGILVSAFSEFATACEHNCLCVLDSIRDIIKRTHSRLPMLAWIEPRVRQEKSGNEGFFSRLWKAICGVQSLPVVKLPEGTHQRFKYFHSIKEQEVSGTAQVLPVNRIMVQQ